MEEIDLKEIFNMFWNRKVPIIIIILIFTIIGGIYTINFVKPLYSSSITLILVSSKGENQENGNQTITTNDITVNSKLILTYSELLKSDNILNKVISNLDIDMSEEKLRDTIMVKEVNNTEMIQITVTHKNPAESAQIANELAKVFSEEVEEMYNIKNIQIMGEADIPIEPSNINHAKDVMIFMIIGIVIGSTYVLIMNMFDTTIKTIEEVENEFKLPVLTSIPIYTDKIKTTKNGDNEELIAHLDAKSPISETFRTLRTNIQFINNKNELKIILVTSTLPKEGKSFISANLAITFAQMGKKVILVDADMRKGRQNVIFKVAQKPGLSNYLLSVNANSKTNISNYVQNTQVDGLSLLPAGDIPPNPSELLVSETMINTVETLRNEYDIVVLDGPPTELVTDSLILTRIVDSTIIVTACKETKKGNLHRIIKNIQNVGGKISGIVVNKMNVSKKKYMQKYYYGEEEKTTNKELQ